MQIRIAPAGENEFSYSNNAGGADFYGKLGLQQWWYVALVACISGHTPSRHLYCRLLHSRSHSISAICAIGHIGILCRHFWQTLY